MRAGSSDDLGDWKPGDRVRLITDPGRDGIVTGKVLWRAGIRRLKVAFRDGDQFVPEDHLELISEHGGHPLEAFAQGRLGRPSDLRRILTHSRLSGRLANLIYSMDVTGTDFYAYQFKPLVRLLNSATTGILIADEVGLGKTIEAGLIWTELRTRFDYKRVLVLCPSVLRSKWQLELRRRFGVRADILDAKGVHELLLQTRQDPFTTQFAAIASLQGVRPPKDLDLDEELTVLESPAARLAKFLKEHEHHEPLIDLLIIDEAHYLRNPSTATAHAGRLFRRTAEYIVLLSATPIHLKRIDLFQMINLIDSDTFTHQGTLEELLEANEPLVRARDLVLSGKATRAEVLRTIDDARRLIYFRDSRQLKHIVDNLPSDEELREPRTISRLAYKLDNANLLGHVLTRTRKRDVNEWRVIREPAAAPIGMSPLEERFYNVVTEAVRDYAIRNDVSEGFLLATPQRQVTSSMPAALDYWLSRAELLEEQLYEDLGDIDPAFDHARLIGPLTQFIVSRVSRFADPDELERSDSKYRYLTHLLQGHLARYPIEKIVLFSYFRPTLEYLHRRLGDDGICTLLLHGDTDDKVSAIETFRDPGGPSVLLSSEVGSEGIDLQFSWFLINYDLPWNPMKVEQRIGRLDRLGQESEKIVIRNLFYENTIDSRIYNRLFERLDIFRRSLGALEPILGERMQQLTAELITKQLTPKQEEERIDQTRIALQNRRDEEEQLEERASSLIAYGDYIINQVNASRELGRHIDAEDLEDYVLDFLALNYPGSEVARTDEDGCFRITLSNPCRDELEAFVARTGQYGITKLTAPTRQGILCKFENKIQHPRSGRYEIISQLHPLVRLIGQRIRADQSANKIGVAVILEKSLAPSVCETGDYVFAAQLWWMKGLKELEFLEYAGWQVKPKIVEMDADVAEMLAGSAAQSGREWLSAADELDIEWLSQILNEHCLSSLESRYEEKVREMEAQNDDRAAVQSNSLRLQYQNQLQSLKKVLKKHQMRKREPLAKATEGKIRALEDRFRRRRIEIEERRSFQHSSIDVVVGVVRIE
ncbi:MAG: hypothetical protein Kow0074_12290 [Candidatus Zixiibacteriota bacterium]